MWLRILLRFRLESYSVALATEQLELRPDRDLSKYCNESALSFTLYNIVNILKTMMNRQKKIRGVSEYIDEIWKEDDSCEQRGRSEGGMQSSNPHSYLTLPIPIKIHAPAQSNRKYTYPTPTRQNLLNLSHYRIIVITVGRQLINLQTIPSLLHTTQHCSIIDSHLFLNHNSQSKSINHGPKQKKTLRTH